MHLCVRGDPFTSVPTTIFQLDFVTFSAILHSLLLFFFVKFFSIRVSLQTMGIVIQMVPIVPIYSHENNKNIPRNQFRLFCFCFDKCSLLVLLYNFNSLKSC